MKIAWDIQQAWVNWMQETYIKDVMSTGCFSKYQLVRLLEIDEDEGPAYALQLYAVKKEDYLHYVNNHLPKNERMSYEKWGNDVLAFSTLMEIIS